MNLYARYLHPHNGYERDKERCKENLVLTERYLVTSVDMSQCITYITLSGLSGRFNSVNFEFENEDESPHNIYEDPTYNPYL